MKKIFEGELIRFDQAGVGVVDVKDKPEFVYFNAGQIRGYRGETIKELVSGVIGPWKKGQTVVIEADVDLDENLHVDSVALKG